MYKKSNLLSARDDYIVAHMDYLGVQTNTMHLSGQNRGVAVTRKEYNGTVGSRSKFDQVNDNGEMGISGSNSGAETSETYTDSESDDGITSQNADLTLLTIRASNTEQLLPNIRTRPGHVITRLSNGHSSNNSSYHVNSIATTSRNYNSHVTSLQNRILRDSETTKQAHLKKYEPSRKMVSKSNGVHYRNGTSLNADISMNHLLRPTKTTLLRTSMHTTDTRTFEPKSSLMNGKLAPQPHRGQQLKQSDIPLQKVSKLTKEDVSQKDNMTVCMDDGIKRDALLCPVTENKQELCRFVETDILGANNVVTTCFGLTKITYLDYIASGRPLKSFEKFITQHVLPTYSNTHTENNYHSQQTSHFRDEARAIIRECVNASHNDAVIFTGSGATAAVHKLIHAMHLDPLLENTKVIVFIGPYEHHSNILPWREMHARIINVPQTKNGLIDLKYLSSVLEKTRSDPDCLLIGSFSAASNVTGILTDVDSIASLMHKYGGYAFFDYASAGPYTDIDMNPPDPTAYKDAVFISPHKFIGGPQTPGILVAKLWMFRNSVPHGVGGGTVVFVRRTAHRYSADVESREEGGTPGIVESIRAGLVFKLKAAFTSNFIMAREMEMRRVAISQWSLLPGLVILGNLEVDRLPIFSMLFPNSATGRLVHQDFIALILNDIFGLQVRSGCACAGPYGMDLMGMSEKMGIKYEKLILSKPKAQETNCNPSHRCPSSPGHTKNLIFKPGFVRLSFPYFMSENCFNFVLKVIKMVSEKGWFLLPCYEQDTGRWWLNMETENTDSRPSLKDITFKTGQFYVRKSNQRHAEGHQLPASVAIDSTSRKIFPVSQTDGCTYEEILNRADRIFAEAKQRILADTSDVRNEVYDEQQKSLRWFMLPSEARDIINGRKVEQLSPDHLPFRHEMLRNKLEVIERNINGGS